MISLSDSELAILMEAAKPLQPHQRAEFLRAVVAELERYEVIGAGVIHRVVAKVQREHRNGPVRYGRHNGKWA